MKQHNKYALKNITNGEIVHWFLSDILHEINRDRSDEWAPYDECDWREGLENFTELRVIGEQI